MTDISDQGQFIRRTAQIAPHSQSAVDVDRLSRAMLVAFAFVFYWLTAVVLEAHASWSDFGADAYLYTLLANGEVHDRIVRFHPLTVGTALVWMKFAALLFPSTPPLYLLSALFAAIGAAGVWAALLAFSVVVPRRFLMFCGALYAFSFGIWYFSSISESKIVTATLASIYIALYIRMRDRPSKTQSAVLTGVLLAACLDEITAFALIVIPVIDSALQRKWNMRWLLLQSLAFPIALFILEVVVNSWLIGPGTDPESRSLWSMFWHYVAINFYDFASVYWFVINWLFFNFAAPAHDALAASPQWPEFDMYFEPSMANYFTNPISAALMVLLAGTIIAPWVPAWRGPPSPFRPILIAMAGFTMLRAGFFLIFNPAEAMLFSPAVTLPHLMIVLIPFLNSHAPAKRPVLIGMIWLLFLTNVRFMIN